MVSRFMLNMKNDAYFIEKSLEQVQQIIKYTKNSAITYEEFLSDDLLVDGIMFRLVQLAEHIKNMSDDYKYSHPEIPWSEIIGFRNGIVHEYGETDFTEVFRIIIKDVCVLKALFEESI